MAYQDRKFKPIVNKCDFYNDPIKSNEDIEILIDKLDEIDDSFESEYDKHEPRLMLCDYCKKEYLIPSF